MGDVVWYNFMFQSIQPFLSCADWISLSRTCRFFYRECNTKRTVFRKFKKDLMRELFDKESPAFSEFLWSGIRKGKAVISGGTMLAIFSGMYRNTVDFGDVDIFYETSPGTFVLNTTKFLPSDYTIETRITDATYFLPSITRVSDIYSKKTSTPWQFIRANPSYKVRNTNGRRIRSIRDHLIANLFENFDLDFCKIVMDTRYLEMFDANAVLTRTSEAHLKIKEKSVDNGTIRSIDSQVKKLLNRCHKYESRGCTVTNMKDIISLNTVTSALTIFFIVYEREVRISKQRKLEEEERIKANNRIITRLLTEKPKSNTRMPSFGSFRPRRVFLPIHEVVEAMTDKGLTPKLVYFFISYTGDPEFMRQCFLKEDIPIDWLITDKKSPIIDLIDGLVPFCKLSQDQFEKLARKVVQRAFPQSYTVPKQVRPMSVMELDNMTFPRELSFTPLLIQLSQPVQPQSPQSP